MLNSAPNKWTLALITEHIVRNREAAEVKPGVWEPARPFGFFSLPSRIKLAWAVFTGEADALFWPNQSPPKAY